VTDRHCNLYSGSMANEPGKATTEVAKTISVPEAGRRYFDLGKNASYNAAKRGEIPVIKIGSRLRVPVVAMERMLEQAGAK
jgi:Helix-turn-helix domain